MKKRIAAKVNRIAVEVSAMTKLQLKIVANSHTIVSRFTLCCEIECKNTAAQLLRASVSLKNFCNKFIALHTVYKFETINFPIFDLQMGNCDCRNGGTYAMAVHASIFIIIQRDNYNKMNNYSHTSSLSLSLDYCCDYFRTPYYPSVLHSSPFSRSIVASMIILCILCNVHAHTIATEEFVSRRKLPINHFYALINKASVAHKLTHTNAHVAVGILFYKSLI